MSEISGKESTRDRLMVAAGELFAFKGYKETTVRDICEKAGANIAAVHYHFGDKVKLYEELVSNMESEIRQIIDSAVKDDVDTPPGTRLHAFVRGFLFRRLDPDRPEWKSKFFHSEMNNPGSFSVSIMRELLEKERAILASILDDLLGPGLEPEKLQRYAQSIVGQALFYFFVHGPNSPPFVDSERLTAGDIEKIARHITEFSLAALEHIGNKNSDEQQ